MPTYEYQCKQCGHRFEKYQSISARPVRRCPKCGGRVERLLGQGAGIIFKGNGFYETDYKRKEQRTQDSSSTLKSDKTSKSSP